MAIRPYKELMGSKVYLNRYESVYPNLIHQKEPRYRIWEPEHKIQVLRYDVWVLEHKIQEPEHEIQVLEYDV